MALSKASHGKIIETESLIEHSQENAQPHSLALPGESTVKETCFSGSPAKSRDPIPCCPGFQASGRAAWLGPGSPKFEEVYLEPQAGKLCGLSRGSPCVLFLPAYLIPDWWTLGSGQFSLALWRGLALTFFWSAPGLCRGEGSPAALEGCAQPARCWQSAVIFHQLHFIIPSGLPLPIDGEQCVITCNWLQITLPSLCKPPPILTCPRLPSGPLGPLAAFLGGPPGAWSTMVILSSWQWSGREGAGYRGIFANHKPQGMTGPEWLFRGTRFSDRKVAKSLPFMEN